MQPSKTIPGVSSGLVFPPLLIDAARMKLIGRWAVDLTMVTAFAAALGALSVWDW